MVFAAQFTELDKQVRRWLGQQCVYCQQSSCAWLCGQCAHELTPIGRHCQTCAREVGLAQTICGRCLRAPHAIDAMYFAYRYRSPLREIILKAKYGRDRGALALLQQCILNAWPDGLTADWIVPIPMSSRRLAWRGFNQTHGLAKALSQHTHIPLHKGILRKHSRKAQSTLTTDASRRANIKGAFMADASLNGHVVLVDDVLTSGATAKEAASVLKSAGASRITFVGIAAR